MERRRRQVATRVTLDDRTPGYGLPPGDHPIWTMGFAHVQAAVAICDLFALLATHTNRRNP